jgi:hypothetical protein
LIKAELVKVPWDLLRNFMKNFSSQKRTNLVADKSKRSKCLFSAEGFRKRFDLIFGGSVWESNPPCRLLAGNTGFEVREGHQSPIHSLMAAI